MKSQLFAMCSLYAMLMGCSSQPHELSPPPCGSVAVPSVCTGNSNTPEVTVNTNSLNFSPPNVCAAPGKTIVFKLVPPVNNQAGDAAILPKVLTDTWLLGTNTADKNKIVVTVPATVGAGNYNYKFVRTNGDCIDPRVEVTR